MPETPYQQWLRERGLAHLDTSPSVPTPLRVPESSTWGTLMKILGTPANVVASGVHAAQKDESVPTHLWGALTGKEKHNFGEIAADAGMKPGKLRTLTGLGLDIATDPLTYIPGATLAKGWKAAGTGIKQATTAARAASPLLDTALTGMAKSTPAHWVDQGLNAITPGREVRHASTLSGGRYGTNAAVRDMELAAARGTASLDAQTRFKPSILALKDELAVDIKKGIFSGLKQGDIVPKMDAALQNIADAIEAGTVRSLSPASQMVAKQWQDFSSGRLRGEIAAGVMRKNWERPNYLTHKYITDTAVKSSSQAHILGDPAFAYKRDYATLVEARLHGMIPDYNIMRLGASRQLAGDRAIIFKRFFEDMFREGKDNPLAKLYMRIGENGKEITPLALKAKQQNYLTVHLPWQEIPLVIADVPEANRLLDFAFHPEVAKDIEAMFTIRPQPGVIGHLVDKIHNLWKPIATVVRPAFLIRNTISNIYMSLPAGMKTTEILPRYAEATKLLAPNFWKEIGRHSAANEAAILRSASDPRVILGKAMGITGVVFGAVGEVSVETGKMLAAIEKRAMMKAVEKLNVVHYGRAASSLSENIGRMALFTHELDRRGLDLPLLQKIVTWSQPEQFKLLTGENAKIYHDAMVQIREASLHVNKWLINYAIKTPFEVKYAQRWMPFYTWARRIVPLLVETAAIQPRILAFQDKLKNEVEQNLSPEERISEERRPAWMQLANYMQTPSTIPGERSFAASGLPGPDLNVVPMIGGSGLFDAAKEMAGRLTPLKSLAEVSVLNRNINMGPKAAIWQNDRWEYTPASGVLSLVGQHAPEFAVDVLHMAKRGDAWVAPATLNYMSAQFLPLVETMGKAARTTQPGQTPDADKLARTWWNFMVGVPNMQRDTPQQEGNRLKGAKAIQQSKLKALAEWLASKAKLGDK